MNERIRELAEQAELNATLFFNKDKLEKFAELIIRECMALCKTSAGNADYNTGRLHCLENIKEHFGVEE